jgi:2-polyprenyl-3-methyl-5-hydroxy-6-metoxy-1,4-benzoquinol methylase
MISIDFSKDAAQFWDKRFSQTKYLFGKEPNAYLKNQAPKYMKPGADALCVADGEGRNSVWLAKQGMIVEAFDISQVAIEKARQLAKNRYQLHSVLPARILGYGNPITTI